jgi:stage II sporulation protein GA (sporulation sigma-E factor processing peptidase)
MDFIVLAIVNRICKYAATYFRLLISATFGALWAIVAVMLPSDIKVIVNICTYVLISFVMIKICAGKCNFRDIVKGVITLYAAVFMLGGMIHLLYYYTYAGYLMKQIVVRENSLILFIIVSMILLSLIYTQLARIKVYSDKKCRICCVIQGREVNMQGFIDTGNVLSDPFIHQPVCIAEKNNFEHVLNEINDYTKVKYHIVPYRSLGCDHGLLEVITVDTMYIYYGEKKREISNALVGLTGNKLSTDGEYSFLVNAQLLI